MVVVFGTSKLVQMPDVIRGSVMPKAGVFSRSVYKTIFIPV